MRIISTYEDSEIFYKARHSELESELYMSKQ